MNQELIKLTRNTTFLTLALIVLCVFWETIGAPVKHGGYWLSLKGIVLLPMIHKLWRGERYAYQVMSLVILLYILEGLLRTFSDSTPSMYYAMVELGLSITIFVFVNMYAYKTKAPKAITEKKSRKTSWLLYFAMATLAVNVMLPSTDSDYVGMDEHGYVLFKTCLEWVTFLLVIPYMLFIGYYRFRGTKHNNTSDDIIQTK